LHNEVSLGHFANYIADATPPSMCTPDDQNASAGGSLTAQELIGTFVVVLSFMLVGVATSLCSWMTGANWGVKANVAEVADVAEVAEVAEEAEEAMQEKEGGGVRAVEAPPITEAQMRTLLDAQLQELLAMQPTAAPIATTAPAPSSLLLVASAEAVDEVTKPAEAASNRSTSVIRRSRSRKDASRSSPVEKQRPDEPTEQPRDTRANAAAEKSVLTALCRPAESAVSKQPTREEMERTLMASFDFVSVATLERERSSNRLSETKRPSEYL